MPSGNALAEPTVAVTPALELRGLSKTFAGRRVLRDVSLSIPAGSVHALVGGNGSGKSTLVKSIAGVQAADPGGTILVNGLETPSDHINPAWVKQAGLRFVHQNPGFFPTMTVADNIALGNGIPATGGIVRRRNLHALANGLLDRFDIHVSPNALMGDLRLADQTMIAIARALHTKDGEHISVLVLDEPTAALPEADVNLLLAAVRKAAEGGTAVIYISHRLEEILDLSDEVTVLRDGQRVASQPTVGMSEQILVSHIVGNPLNEVFPPPAARRAVQPVVAELSDVTAGLLRGVSLKVHQGEVLGIAGLLGSGRTDLLETLFADVRIDRGQILLGGQQVQLGSPADAMRCGIAYIPEHRETEAAFPDMSVRKNLSAADIRKHSRAGVLSHRDERRAAKLSIEAFRVRSDGDEALMATLSGGNQQKVILARWLRNRPKLLLLNEPTQGVDVGSRADAYQLIREAVNDGTGVILVSSDFEELAEMSDRVLILHGGRIVAEATGHDVTRHRLTELVFLAGEADA